MSIAFLSRAACTAPATAFGSFGVFACLPGDRLS